MAAQAVRPRWEAGIDGDQCYHVPMTSTLVLFDIDGTILLTDGAGVTAMSIAGRALFGDHFTLDDYDPSGMLDPIIYDELARRHNVADHHQHHETFRDAYVAQLQTQLDRKRDRVRLLPGVRQTLDLLRQRDDMMLGVLSGNYRAAAPLKFASVGVDPAWFSIWALGDEAPSRPDLVALAMKRYQEHTGHSADPKRVVIVGDTPRDVDCAKAHGCRAFAVATGRFSVDQLRQAGADCVAEDLSEPSALMNWLNQLSG